jgi:blocked early in transport 1
VSTIQLFGVLALLTSTRQNNSRLDELASKVSALRGVTMDIEANARDQGIIDSTSETFSNMATSLKGSAVRLGRMAQSGNKVAVLKLAGIVIGVVILLWWIWGLFTG